ncbi:MAG: hypothetical protein WCC11_07615 [Gammaproteobacteria bacterium]
MASPVTIGVTSNTEIVNGSGTGAAVTLPATVNGTPYTLICNASASTCSLSQSFPIGAYTLSVTAPVAVPAFYSVSGSPFTCNFSMGVYGLVNQCATLTATANFAVGCTPGRLTVISNTTLIPVPAGQSTSIQLAAQGGCPPYTWTVGSPSGLPPGISISPSGLVSGTETTACTPDPYTFDNSITVTDSTGDTGQSPMTFDIC